MRTMFFSPNTGLHLNQNPNGSWSFVGRVPAELAYHASEADLQVAAQVGPMIAGAIARKHGRTFETCTWATRDAALAAAEASGYVVAGGDAKP